MSKSAKSIHYFSFYLLLTGVTLLFSPNMLLGTFGLPTTTEVYIRIVGMLVFLLGIYYFFTAKHDLTQLIRVSVFTRISVILFFSAFIAMGWVNPALLLFGAVDLLGAIWTFSALKAEKKW